LANGMMENSQNTDLFIYLPYEKVVQVLVKSHDHDVDKNDDHHHRHHHHHDVNDTMTF
jgi:hypothetical protein